MKKLKLSLAALGLGTVIAAGPAVGAITWQPDGVDTIFQDDDLDFILNNDLTPKISGDIVAGDVLLAVFEVNQSSGVDILPDELTGVSAVEVDTVTPIGGGLANFTFVAYSGGLDAVLGLAPGGVICPAGSGCAAGGDALVAMFVDPAPNLDIEASALPIPLSCSTLSQCIDQAVDGAAWQVDALDATDLDTQWIATAAPINPFPILTVSPGLTVGTVNGLLNHTFNGTGRTINRTVSCFPFCGLGGDGFVDLVGTGSIQGGAGLEQSLIDSGVFGTSDFDFVKNTTAVPEPSTLALLAAGFMGVGFAQRRRRKASQA